MVAVAGAAVAPVEAVAVARPEEAGVLVESEALPVLPALPTSPQPATTRSSKKQRHKNADGRGDLAPLDRRCL